MKILAAYNIKGGVGKTAAAVNLAYVASQSGLKILLWDLDPQGAASFYFRIKPKIKGGGHALINKKRVLEDVVKGTDYDRLDVIPADFSYRNMDLELAGTKKPVKQLLKRMKPVSEEYDYLILDCAPSISLVSENVFHAADALLVPLIPTTLSLRAYQKLLKHLSNVGLNNVKVLPFFSMVDRRKKLHREMVESLSMTYPELASVAIPYASQIESMGIHRQPVGAYASGSVSADAYLQLWKELAPKF